MGTVFSAYDIRGRVGDTLTIEHAWTVGKAFAEWLPDSGVVLVVRSESADNSIVNGVTQGLLLQGRDVMDGGEGDKSRLVALVSEKKAAGAILVSHDDVQNIEIITLFDCDCSAIGDRSLDEIRELVESGNFLPAADKGELVA